MKKIISLKQFKENLIDFYKNTFFEKNKNSLIFTKINTLSIEFLEKRGDFQYIYKIPFSYIEYDSVLNYFSVLVFTYKVIPWLDYEKGFNIKMKSIDIDKKDYGIVNKEISRKFFIVNEDKINQAGFIKIDINEKGDGNTIFGMTSKSNQYDLK